MIPIVLASKSAVRARLLTAARVPFEAADSGVDEAALKAASAGLVPKAVADVLAEAKARAVAARRPDAIVIGADQTLEADGRLYDKAASLDEARARLRLLRGRGHQLHSAAAVVRGGAVVWRKTASATLAMRDFTDAWLDGYLGRNPGPALSSVGCYELEGEGAQLFERIVGDYFAILGLPLLGLLGCLREHGALAR